jgi:hypothetical protein
MTSAVTAPTATAATEITVAVPATSSSRTDKKLLRKSKRIYNATSELQSDFYGEFKTHRSN